MVMFMAMGMGIGIAVTELTTSIKHAKAASKRRQRECATWRIEKRILSRYSTRLYASTQI